MESNGVMPPCHKPTFTTYRGLAPISSDNCRNSSNPIPSVVRYPQLRFQCPGRCSIGPTVRSHLNALSALPSPSTKQPPGKRIKRGCILYNNCANSGLQPFSLFLNVGGNKETTSNVIVPFPLHNKNNDALALLVFETSVAVYLVHLPDNLLVILVSANVSTPFLSIKAAFSSPLSFPFAQKVN